MSDLIAVISNLPLYHTRCYINNTNINDIVTCIVGGKRIYCIVTGLTPTGIKVTDLYLEVTNTEIKLYRDNIINSNHRGVLVPPHISNNSHHSGRLIHKIENIQYLNEYT
tara:strand:- start:190 stop:519 length:330 start_codon:yes stop_codon:yes gene_type:complete